MSEEDQVSRRGYVKYAAAGVVVVAVAAGGGYYYTQTQKEAKTIRYLGDPFHFPEDAATKWNEENPMVQVEQTFVPFFALGQRQLADSTAWDIGSSGRHRQLISGGVLQQIPIEKVPRWELDKVLDIFNDPGKGLPLMQQNYPAQVDRFLSLLWYEPVKSFASIPFFWNFDSCTYLPEFLPYEEKPNQTSLPYSEVWNPEWKGRVGHQDEGLTTFAETTNELNAEGELPHVPNPCNMEEDEVDRAFNYLLPIVKSGQIRTFWFDYGDIVNLLSTREIWISSTWQPPSYDSRKAGTPAYYASLKNGPFMWYNCFFMSKDHNPDVTEECYDLMSWSISLWRSMLYTRQGYPTSACYWPDYIDTMGDEFYNWFYTGQPTYKSNDDAIKEDCWPDNPEHWELDERLKNAMFTHDVYFKNILAPFFTEGKTNPRSGTPNPKGNVRDLTSNEYKKKITRYFLSPELPDKNDYYVKKFEELKANLPG